MTAGTSIDGERSQASWDRQQESYLPDREERFAAMLDTVEAVAGTAPRILDLAGGTGSISLRAAARFPEARSTLVDIDAALLAIAAATVSARGLAGRVRVVEADLAEESWVEAVEGPYAGGHRTEFVPTLAWQERALRAAGFREVGLVWRGLTDAAVCGVR